MDRNTATIQIRAMKGSCVMSSTESRRLNRGAPLQDHVHFLTHRQYAVQGRGVVIRDAPDVAAGAVFATVPAGDVGAEIDAACSPSCASSEHAHAAKPPATVLALFTDSDGDGLKCPICLVRCPNPTLLNPTYLGPMREPPRCIPHVARHLAFVSSIACALLYTLVNP